MDFSGRWYKGLLSKYSKSSFFIHPELILTSEWNSWSLMQVISTTEPTWPWEPTSPSTSPTWALDLVKTNWNNIKTFSDGVLSIQPKCIWIVGNADPQGLVVESQVCVLRKIKRLAADWGRKNRHLMVMMLIAMMMMVVMVIEQSIFWALNFNWIRGSFGQSDGRLLQRIEIRRLLPRREKN